MTPSRTRADTAAAATPGDHFGIPAHLIHEPGRFLSGWLRFWSRIRGGLIGTVFVTACILEGIGVVLLQVVNAGTGPPNAGYVVLMWIVLAVACGTGVLLLWRRRWPVAVSVITSVTTSIVGLSVAADIALTCAAIRRRGWTLAGLAALRVCVLFTVFVNPLAHVLVVQQMTIAGPSPLDVITPFIVITIDLLIGLWIGSRRQLSAVWRDRALRGEQQQRLQLEGARLAERNRIAKEMHDVVAHKVSLIALQAGGLEVSTGDETARNKAGLIRTTARNALEDLRTVLGSLHEDSDPAALAPQAAGSDIPALIDQSVQSGVRVTLRSDIDLATLPDGLGRAAYRIVQESLTNVHKHARGSGVTVSLRRITDTDAGSDDSPATGPESGDRLQIIVVNTSNTGNNNRPDNWDAGVGAESLPGSGRGLAGLAERAELLHGTLNYGPTATGWRVTALLPLQEGP